MGPQQSPVFQHGSAAVAARGSRAGNRRGLECRGFAVQRQRFLKIRPRTGPIELVPLPEISARRIPIGEIWRERYGLLGVRESLVEPLAFVGLLVQIRLWVDEGRIGCNVARIAR